MTQPDIQISGRGSRRPCRSYSCREDLSCSSRTVCLNRKTMKINLCIAMVLAAFSLSGLSEAQTPNTYKSVEAAAMKGDYQAQRNLAYGYASFPYEGQIKNPMLACAWYTVVLNSGSPMLGPGDVGNVNVYCGKLDALSRSAAEEQSRQLFSQIYKRKPRF